MHLVCLVLVACSILSKPEPGKSRVSCDVEASSCTAVSDAEETEMRTACVANTSCLEASPRIFVLRRMVAEKAPGETKL